MSFPAEIKICDPHFHVWDVTKFPNPNLGGIVDAEHPVLKEKTTKLGIYTGTSYKTDIDTLPFAAAVHVETCVGQIDGGYVLDTNAETAFVLENAKLTGIPIAVVAFVQLGREDAASIIGKHRDIGGNAFRGIRMILNYSPTDPSVCWPQVGTDVYLKGTHEIFNKNMKLLTEQGLVFDLHCNWFQLAEAATYFTTHSPSTVVVLDHLGCVKLDTGSADEDNKRIEEWKQGMTALSANPNVNVKISGLEYIKANWLVSGSASRAVIQDLVVFVVKTFSPSRCMVASNWPVDLFMGKSTLTELYVGIHDLLSSFTVEERQAMFYGNAMRVYGVDKL